MRHSNICRPETSKLRGVILEVKFLGRDKKRENKKKFQSKMENKKDHMLLRAHLSMPALFMMVSLPDEAAFTICCSTDLFILALSAYNEFQLGCTAE